MCSDIIIWSIKTLLKQISSSIIHDKENKLYVNNKYCKQISQITRKEELLKRSKMRKNGVMIIFDVISWLEFFDIEPKCESCSCNTYNTYNNGNDTHIIIHICRTIFKIPTSLVHLRPKFFHPLELGRPVSKEPPSTWWRIS